MITIKKEEYILYKHLFDAFTHHQAVIFSVFEEQYEGILMVDDKDDPKIAILFTPFAFHFITGDATVTHAEKTVYEAIFKDYANTTDPKEIIVFHEDKRWKNVLDRVFAIHSDILVKRFVYAFDVNRFNKLTVHKDSTYDITILQEEDPLSAKPLIAAHAMKDHQSIGYCKAMMIGSNKAEVDVFVDESYRGKGIAKTLAHALIKQLVDHGFSPSWSAWDFRKASHTLAEKLGFNHEQTVTAHVWLESECGPIKITE